MFPRRNSLESFCTFSTEEAPRVPVFLQRNANGGSGRSYLAWLWEGSSRPSSPSWSREKAERFFTGYLLISPTTEAPHIQQGGSAHYRAWGHAHASSSAAQGLKCELERQGAAQELVRGREGEPSSQAWSSKGRVAVQGGAGSRAGSRAQDSSLCTATVMLSCFWIMMFLQQGARAEGGQLGGGSGQGNH